MVEISVVYAEAQAQWERRLRLPAGSTVADALRSLGEEPPFGQLALTEMPVGIWGAIVDRCQVLSPMDRLELYRPLVLDPLEARRQRAQSHR